MAKYGSIVHTFPAFLMHSSVDGHLGSFRVLAVVNGAAVNAGMRVCLDRGVHGYVPSRGTAGSRDRFILSLLKSLHTILHGGSTEFTSLPTARWDSHFSTPCPALTVHSFSFIFLFGCSGSQL